MGGKIWVGKTSKLVNLYWHGNNCDRHGLLVGKMNRAYNVNILLQQFYIAPLAPFKVVYSGALPIHPRSNNVVVLQC